MNKKFRFPKELGEKWVQALRSGKYKQGRNRLYTPSVDEYCCLGVLGNLCGMENSLLVCNTMLTDLLLSSCLNIPEELSTNTPFQNYFVTLNDGIFDKEINPYKKVHTFTEIADCIEENVEFY